MPSGVNGDYGNFKFEKDFGIKMPYEKSNDFESALFDFGKSKDDSPVDFNSPEAWSIETIMKNIANVPDVKYNAKEVTKAYFETDGKRAEDHGVFSKDAVTLNPEQSVSILKSSGYNVENCHPNIANDGTVSFQFGDQHVRVVVDPNSGEVGILKTQIQGENTLVTRYKVDGAKVDKNQPDANGIYNKTQIDSIIEDFVSGKQDLVARDENGRMTGGLNPLLNNEQIYEAVMKKLNGEEEAENNAENQTLGRGPILKDSFTGEEVNPDDVKGLGESI